MRKIQNSVSLIDENEKDENKLKDFDLILWFTPVLFEGFTLD
jgi:hypothetical protein